MRLACARSQAPIMFRARALVSRLPACARPLPVIVRRVPGVRCLASKRDSDDKSWAEIASEATTVVKEIARKVGSTVKSAVEAVKPSKEDRAVRQREQEGQERERRQLYREPGLGGGGGLVSGLLGRTVGRMVQSALGALGEQMREAQEQAADVQQRAADLIENDARVRQRLGGPARCMAPMSQGSMTQSINGRVSRVVTLVLPVVGQNGRSAQAQVRWVEGGDRAEEQLSVSVRLPGGEVLQLDGGGATGKTIDVEYRSLD